MCREGGGGVVLLVSVSMFVRVLFTASVSLLYVFCAVLTSEAQQ